MTRKWLFGGLTVILLAVLVALIIQGHNLEKQKVNQPVDIIQKSKPSPTRALGPKDIEIVQSEMKMEPSGSGAGQVHTARHRLEIRNTGRVAYESIELSFDYLDSGKQVLDTHSYSLNQVISPASTLNIEDIEIDGIPPATADFSVTILFADIAKIPVSKE
jgi:hypothetical protein